MTTENIDIYSLLEEIPIRFNDTKFSKDKIEYDFKFNEKEINIFADIPGMKKEDISVEIINNNLIISGNRQTPKELSGDNCSIRKYRYGSFSTTISLPYKPAEENILCRYIDGVLLISIPRIAKERIKISII